MAHPQSSPRGYKAYKRLDIGGAQLTPDTTGNLRLNAGVSLSGVTGSVLTHDSTAAKLPGGLVLSGKASSLAITQDSTAVKVAGGIVLSGKASSLAITQNSTSVNLPGGVKVSAKANAVITGLSTGIVITAFKMGAHWITANSTGLKIGANQVLSTA